MYFATYKHFKITKITIYGNELCERTLHNLQKLWKFLIFFGKYKHRPSLRFGKLIVGIYETIIVDDLNLKWLIV